MDITKIDFANGSNVAFASDSITKTAADGTSVVFTIPSTTEAFVPTEAQVQAAVDAGIIAAYTPATAPAEAAPAPTE